MTSEMIPKCPFCGYSFDAVAPKGQVYRCPECRQFFNIGESRKEGSAEEDTFEEKWQAIEFQKEPPDETEAAVNENSYRKTVYSADLTDERVQAILAENRVLFASRLLLYFVVCPLLAFCVFTGRNFAVVVGGNTRTKPAMPNPGDTVRVELPEEYIENVAKVELCQGPATRQWWVKCDVDAGRHRHDLHGVVKYKVEPLTGQRVGPDVPVEVSAQRASVTIMTRERWALRGKQVELKAYRKGSEIPLTIRFRLFSPWSVRRFLLWLFYAVIVLGIVGHILRPRFPSGEAH